MTVQHAETEQALQSLTATFARSQVCCLIADEQGRILFLNQAAHDLLGHAESEMLGKPLSDLVEADSRQAIEIYIARSMTQGEALQFDLNGLHKDGSALSLSFSATPVAGTEPQRPRVFLTVSDCSPLEQTAQRLIDARFKLAAIVGCSPSALSLKHPDGRYALANPNLQKIHHLNEDQIIGKSDFDLYPAEVARAFRRNDALVMESKTKQSVEELVPVDGVIKTYMSHVFPIFDEQGEIRFICRISLDISDKKASDAEVFKLVQAIEQSPFPILITDSKRRVEFVNSAFTQTTGYSREEAIGKTPDLLKSGKTSKATYADLNQTLESGKSWKGEFCNRRKDGTTYIDSVVISPLMGPDGKISHFVSIRQNITEQRENEIELRTYQSKLEDLVSARTQELNEAKIAAETANSAKSRFLATISHEIRTPLGGIKGISDLLGSQELSPESRELINLQKSAIAQLSGLLNNVLDYSKIEAGMFEFESHNFDFRKLINDIGELKKVRCAQKGIEFVLDNAIPADRRYVGDPVRVRQIIQNLLSNAYKYTTEGSISMRVASRPCDDSSDLITVTVSDTGIGISSEDQQNLFKPFVQAEQSELLKAQGTGLGLSIVKELAEKMHGGVRVESQLGVGTTFTIHFKLGHANTGKTQRTKLESAAPRHQLNILIADDDSLTRKIMFKLLSNMGHRVSEAASGASALSEMSNQRFDIVITDYSMPDMTGAQLLEQAKQRTQAETETKFICLSGHTQTDFIESLNRLGFDAYFSKPLNLDLLEQKLNEFSQHH